MNKLPYVVLTGGVLITVVIGYLLYQSGYEKEYVQFERSVDQVEQAITERIETYLALLIATRGFMYAHDTVDRAAFTTFVNQLNLRENYPGLQGIGYAERVDPGQKTAFEQRQRRQGTPNFTIQPVTPNQPAYPIVFLDPPDRRNTVALGFDMYSNPVRREAMEKARDTGEVRITGRVTLVQEFETNPQPGFLIYLPLYRSQTVPDSEAERRDELTGYVYQPFRAGDFFTEVFKSNLQPDISVAIYDAPSVDDEHLLFRHSDATDTQPYFSLQRQVNYANRPWTIVYSSRARLFTTAEWRFLPYFMLFGVGGTLALFFITRSLVKARLQAEDSQLELIKYQVALQSSEERLRLVVEGMKDLAIITLDLKGTITSWNPGADRFFGYTERYILGKNYALFFTPRERKLNKPVHDLKQVLTTGSLEFERMMIRRNRTRFWASGLMAALYDSAGELRGLAMVVQDVTHRKQAEAQLHKQQALTQAVINSLSSQVAVLDKSGTIISANTSWQQFADFLHDQHELAHFGVGTNYIKLLEQLEHSEVFPEVSQLATGIHQVLHQEVPEFSQEFQLRLGYEEVWFMLTANTLRHVDQGVVISQTNITSLKKLDQQKNEFLSIASHELKTPITSARVYAQVLQQYLQQTKHQQGITITEKIISQVDKMQLLIADLLDISKIEAGKLQLNEQRFVIDELVMDIAESMQLTTPSHVIRVTGSTKSPVSADRERIGQVLTNLIDNAIKYSPDADKVEIDLSERETEIVVTVRDFGIGISAQDKEHLFQRFYRAQHTGDDKVYPGLGLGLYICFEIVKRSGGKLDVQSETGRGSEFSFTLPKADSLQSTTDSLQATQSSEMANQAV